MATLTAANAAAFGHQGAHQGLMAFYAGGRPEAKSLRHCLKFTQTRGYPTEYFGKVGAVVTATSESEGAAAATPSALPTPTGVTMTPAGFQISISINNAAQWRANENNDPLEISREEIKYGCGIYMMDDATVGLGALFDTVTASDGDPGATLTVDGLLDSPAAIRSNIDDSNLAITDMIDGKGAEDVNRDILTNASSFLSNPKVSNHVTAIVDGKGMLFDEDDGFWFSPDGRTGVYVEAGYSMLVQQGGDRVGCAFISPTEAVSGRGLRMSKSQTQTRRIAPAFGICYFEDPNAAARIGMGNQIEDIVTEGGVVTSISVDWNTGADLGIIRGRGKADVALLNDNSACELRYLA